MPRHQRWQNQTKESHCYCIWWVYSCETPWHLDLSAANIWTDYSIVTHQVSLMMLPLCFVNFSFFKDFITVESGGKLSQQLWNFSIRAILHKSMRFLNFRPPIYSHEAQTWTCDGGTGRTEILQNLSQTTSVPRPWSHLVRDPWNHT